MINNILSNNSFLFVINSDFIEALQQKYHSNPMDVSEDWRHFFETLAIEKDIISNSLLQPALFSELGQNIIDAYRCRGHLLADLDPLQLTKIITKQEAHLSKEALRIPVDSQEIHHTFQNKSSWKAIDLIVKLEEIYCKKISIEASHINDIEEQKFLYEHFENLHFNKTFKIDEKKYFLRSLFEIENFEHTIHIKFPGAKRFSCEGSESSILAIKWLIDIAAEKNIDDIVILVYNIIIRI